MVRWGEMVSQILIIKVHYLWNVVPEAGIKGRDKLSHPTDIMGGNYMSMPLIHASGTTLLINWWALWIAIPVCNVFGILYLHLFTTSPGATVKVWGWISNLFLRFTMCVITYPCCDWSHIMLVKDTPEIVGYNWWQLCDVVVNHLTCLPYRGWCTMASFGRRHFQVIFLDENICIYIQILLTWLQFN